MLCVQCSDLADGIGSVRLTEEERPPPRSGVESRSSSAYRELPQDFMSSLQPTDSSTDQNLGEILAAMREETEPSATLVRKNDDFVLVAAGHEENYLKTQQERFAKSKKSMQKRVKMNEAPVIHSGNSPLVDNRGGHQGRGETVPSLHDAVKTSVDSSYNSGSSTCDDAEWARPSPSARDDNSFCVIAEPQWRSPAPCQQDVPTGQQSAMSADTFTLEHRLPPASNGVCNISEAKGFMVAVSGDDSITISPLGRGAGSIVQQSTRMTVTSPMGRGQRLEMQYNAAMRRPGGSYSAFQ
jgi:hypothetical protein